jgi:ParB-like chromosome segregation protein Spo0J
LQLIQDPEFRDIVPPLMDEEYSQLEKNIMEDGIREPLVIWNGIIIDGNNRFKICAEHGIHFETVEKDLPDRQAAIKWITLNQFGRRNLSPGNRSILALRLEPIFRERAKEKQKGGQGGVLLPLKSAEAIETRKEVAKIAGVGHDTIGKVLLTPVKHREYSRKN